MQSDHKDFSALGLGQKVLRGVKAAGFTTPSPIQKEAIPEILKQNDLIAQAQTGTGKTAAFALPILQMIDHKKGLEALVITPTRELAMQISDEIFKLGKYLRTRTVCVYGGQSIKKQCELIAKNPQVMVATPGRLLDHLQNGRLEDFTPRFVVLDESDEMLDMGFLGDIEEIFNYLPNNIQILLFSATIPDPIKKLAQRILRNPKHIRIAPSDIINTDIAQYYYMIEDNNRQEAMTTLLDKEEIDKGIIFTRTKKEANNLYEYLRDLGYKVQCLHGDMDQRSRRQAITEFKERKCRILVATDVASRGLDISDVSHVFNYHIPLSAEIYVHRIGRTGRAGKKGRAITLTASVEFKELKNIQKEVGGNLKAYESGGAVRHFNQHVFKEILKFPVSNEAFELYEAIKEDCKLPEITLRLLSMYLETLQKNNKKKPHPKHSYHKSHRGARR